MGEYEVVKPAPTVKSVPEATPPKIDDSTSVKDAPAPKKDEMNVLDYFQFVGWGELLLNPELDVHGAKGKLLFIENYLKDQIKEQGLKDERDSYFGLLDQIERSLKLTGSHDQHVRVNKVYKVMKVLDELRKENDLEQEKISFLNRFGKL